MRDQNVWKDAQPTVDESLEFADLGLAGSNHPIAYPRALRALAAEVRRLRGAAEPGGNRCFACSQPVPALSPEMQQRLDTALAAFGPMATIHRPGCAILSAAGNPACSCGAVNRT